ncbi:MAG: sulfite exporter TauE/SafE family protein, partial [Gallionellaceae bacterium]|nr:sulfite exporter TauE/SafE family protein [Gallionellaceae bacterium]
SLVKPRLGMEYRPRNREGAGLVVGMAGMFLVGFLNGSITSGSGLFLTIWLIRHFGLDYQRAVAYTMILGGLFWNGTGAAVLGVLGTVQWDWMPVLLAGAVIGGYLGSHVAIVKGNLWVKRAFEVTTVLIGLKLIIG